MTTMFKTQDPLIFQHLADVGLADTKQQQEVKDARTVHCG